MIDAILLWFKVEISVPGKTNLVNFGTELFIRFREISNLSDFCFVFVNNI